jgi:hypothetical protein
VESRSAFTIAERERIERRSRQAHSWLYWAVWRTRTFRWAVAGGVLLWASLVYYAAASLNPSLPFAPGSNTIDRLTDPRVNKDYTAAGLTGIAISGRFVAAGTERGGLIVIPVAGSFPRGVLEDSGIVSVSSGLSPSAFFALQTNQRLSEVQASRWEVSREALLDPPSQPAWPGIEPFAPDAVLLTKMDDRGLLLVASRAGIARYAMDPDGSHRRRCWQAVTLPFAQPYTHAALAADGIWVAGGGGIAYVRLNNLKEEPKRRLSGAGAIVGLDAGRNGSWASAVAEDGRTYLFASENWTGPWFGRPDHAENLQRAADVVQARKAFGVLWLATASDVFSHHEMSGTMRLLIPNSPSTEIEPIADGVLFAGRAGLFLEPSGRSDAGALNTLDGAPASRLRVSPSGDTIVWRSNPNGQGSVYKTSVRPFNSSLPLSAGNGWGASAPRVVGLASTGVGTVFGTSRGCLLYNALTPAYKDCSRILPSKQRPEGQAEAFSFLEENGGVVLGIAGGVPLVFDSGQAAWNTINGGNRTLRGITGAAGSVYGLTASGSLLRFPSSGGDPEEYLRGFAPAFSGNEFVGDLSGVPDDWRLALVAGRQWTYYSSVNGSIEAHEATEPIRQIRLHKGAPLLVSASGSVLSGDGSPLFGWGEMPFAPARVRAIARGNGGSVLVGGPEGVIVRYSWTRGSWEALPPVPGGGLVREMSEDGGGIWAEAQDIIGRWTGQKWDPRPGYSFFLVEKPGARVWLGGDLGVMVENRDEKGGATVGRYSTGEGLRQFASSARCVWQIDADRVALFGEQGGGVFDRRTDRWQTRATQLSPDIRCFPAKGALIVAEGSTLHRFSPELEDTVLLSLSNSELRAVHVRDDRIEALALVPGEVRLSVWDGVNASGPSQYLLADDSALDATIGSDGRVWVLRRGEIWEAQIKDSALATVGKQRRVSEDATSLAALASGSLSFLAPQNASARSAILEYGPQRLEWMLGAQGANLSWRRRPDLPVWCGDRGKLTVQCINGLSTSGDTLLVGTSFGVIRRRLSDYSLIGVDAGTGLPARSQTLVLEAGLYTFSLSQQGLSVRSQSGLQDWQLRRGGYYLRADLVTWVHRGREDSLAIETPSGRARWTPESGRVAGEASIVSDVVSIDTPAIRIRLRDGRVALASFDGKSPFEQGRLFFDSTAALRGQGGSLFTLVAGRCLIQRDGSRPGRIISALPLPPSAGPGTLERGERGVRYTAGQSIWELAAEGGGAQWNPASGAMTEGVTGLITWRRQVGGLFPYFGSTQLNNWWGDDRFAWDDVLAAGALDQGAAILVTPIGIVLRRAGANGSTLESILLQTGLTSCVVARRGPAITGMLVNGHILDRGPVGGLRQRLPAPGESGMTAHLVLDSVEGETGRRIIFVEEWGTGISGPALSSRLPALPTQRLISQGRFAFDDVKAIGGGGGDDWVATADCGGSCLGAVFRRRGDVMELREIVSLPPVSSIRSNSSGLLFGRDGRSVVSLRIENGRLHAEEGGSPGDAFYAGDAVSFDVERLAWSSAPRHGSEEPALKVNPAGFPLLASYSNGVAFSFDILRSVAALSVAGEVALGTDGGVLFCPERRPLDLSAQAGCRLDRGGQLGIENVTRLRAWNGELWAEFGGGKLAVWSAGKWRGTDQPPPWQTLQCGHVLLSVRPTGIQIDDTEYSRSNDAWGIGARPIEDIIDLGASEDGSSAWLCSRLHGLFKLRIGLLAEHRARGR